MTTGKNIALTIWTFVSKVMSLLSNTLSRFVIALQHVWDAKKKKKHENRSFIGPNLNEMSL